MVKTVQQAIPLVEKLINRRNPIFRDKKAGREAWQWLKDYLLLMHVPAMTVEPAETETEAEPPTFLEVGTDGIGITTEP